MRIPKTLKWIFDFYLFGNFHIALCAVAITLTTQSFFYLSLRRELLVFVFCGTFFGYNLQRLPAVFEKNSIQRQFRRHHWNTQHRILLTLVSAIAAIAFIWSFSQLHVRSQLVALVPAFLSFAYAFPVIPARGKWRKLREISGIKIFIIAITWAISCVLLPFAAVHHSGATWFSAAALLWALACALLIFALTVPFDVRDLHYDAEKLKALPSLLGVKKSIYIAIAALIISAVIPWINWHYLDTGNERQALAYSVWAIIASVFVYRSSPERQEYYFSFVIDGLILLLGLMVCNSRLLFGFIQF